MTAKIDKIIRLEAPTQQASNRDRSLSLQGFRKLKGENQVQLEQFLKNLSPCLLQYKFAVYDDKGSIFIEARQEIQNSSFKNDSPEIFARMSDIFEVLMDYQEKIFRKCNLDNFFVNNREILMQEIFDLLLKILHEKSSKVGQYIEENYKFTNKCEFEAFKKRFEKSLQEKNQKAICDYVDIYNSFQENYQTIYYCPSLVSLHRSKLNDMVRGYILDQIYLTHMKNGINSSIVYEELKKDFKKYFLEDAGSDLFEPETYDGPDNLSILFHIILLTDYHKDNGNDPILNIATIKQFYKIFIHQWTEIYPALKESYGLAMSAHQDSLVQQQMAKCLESFKERWSNNVKRPNLIAMMALFIGFHFVSSESKMNKSYDPHCRAMLMSVFRNLKDGENIFSNDQILCCMESLIMEYSELIDQPRVNMNSSVSLVLKSVRNTVVKNVTEKLVHQKQVECLQSKISNEIIKPKTFFFEKISSLSNNSRAIFIVVSGFTSELDINSDEWKVLPGLFPNSEVIALNWKSNSIKQMVEKIGGDAIKDALPFASIGILFVWMRFVTSGISKVKEEWNLTYQQAITTGVYLAHFLAKTNILKGHILNLVGFSLGTLVVMSCVWELERIQRYDIVYDVLLMGGVVNIDDFYKHSLKSVNNRLINCYSRTDMILSMMLKSANPEVSPIGLGPILWPNKKVRNVDVTHVADGHSKYRPALREVIVRTGFSEELHPLFKTYSNGVL